MSDPAQVTPAVPASTPSLKHELRTPLNHIIGYCEMLTEEAQDNALTKLLPDLERIHTAGRKLLSVINEICDPEKLPGFRANPGLLDHDVRTPLNQIIGYAEMLQDEARESGPETVVADLERIHAAARELLRRVVLHFPAAPMGRGATETPLRDHATTVFNVSRAPPAPAESPAPTGRVLVVDDDEGNRTMLARRLSRMGHTVVLANDGREALAKLRAEDFDLMLLDIQMPGMNGYQVLEAIKADADLARVQVIVLSASDETSRVARCIEMGAEDYLPKPFDPVLLRARIHASLERKQLRERERQAFEALQKSQKELSEQLAEAAHYVRSLLPAPVEGATVRADWRFLPGDQLGGDALGYHWLDERRFAFYVLDVCGHGVGAALLSVSVMNVLKNRSMPNVNFANPGEVLAGLNHTFPMEEQNNMFFTIWYGVLGVDTRELVFACGGHPPAVLLSTSDSPARLLAAKGAIVGGFPEALYATGHVTLATGDCLCVFSDGIYELERADGSTAQLQDFVSASVAAPSSARLDAMLKWAEEQRDGGKFADDVSILELRVT
jgi:sigma-B regulation protein RsbU (phosphoserine phosphatase)